MEFGSDNYHHVRAEGATSLTVYRGYFHTITQAVLYMDLKLFATNGKVYCTAEAIQNRWINSLPYPRDMPVEASNKPKLPLKLFEKPQKFLKLYHRDYNMRTHS